MGRSLTIHAGLPKCGSTALQFILASNRGKLLEAGILYPGNEEEEGIGHMAMSTDLVEASRSGRRSAVLARAVADFAASGASRLVLSSEGFAIRSPKFERVAFAGLLDDLDVAVVLFVRRRDEWTRSFYKQQVKNVGRAFDGTLGEFVAANAARRLRPGHIADTLDRFAGFVGARTVTVAHLDLAGAGTPELFGAAIGVPLGSYAGDAAALSGRKAIQFAQGLPINVAFSDVDTMFLAAVNGLGLRRALNNDIREALSRIDTRDVAPDVRILAPDLAARLLADGAEDDARLSALYGAPAGTFVPRVEEGADYRERLTHAEFEEIRARVVAALDEASARRLTAARVPFEALAA